MRIRHLVVAVILSLPVVGCLGSGDDEQEALGVGVRRPRYSATIGVVMVDDSNGDGLPNWHETIAFDVSEHADQLQLACSQDGVLVASGYGCSTSADCPMLELWPWLVTFNLWSGAWTGGPAECTVVAQVFGRKTTTIGSLSFPVGP